MRLARDAAAHGWDISVELAAHRLERARPRTWLEADLTMAAIHAWICGRRRFAVPVTDPAGSALAERLPGTPVVRASARRILLGRTAVLAGIEQAIEQPSAESAQAPEPDDVPALA
jgi:hypothetical protein